MCNNNINKKDSHDYCALQTSYTLLRDSLTMFRLYGKKDGVEGTGVNIIFKKQFFSKDIKPPLLSGSEKALLDKKEDTQLSDRKLPLYFVLYYNPDEDLIVFNPFDKYKSSVIDLKKKYVWKIINQMESDGIDAKLRENYLNNIGYVITNLRDSFYSIKKSDEIAVAKKLLLHINYLVKDIAFVEEKELRMISVVNMKEDNLKHDDKKNSFVQELYVITRLFDV